MHCEVTQDSCSADYKIIKLAQILSELLSISFFSINPLNKLVSDTCSELVEEAGYPNHVSRLGKTEVQCLVPLLTALVLVSRRHFSASSRPSETSSHTLCRVEKHLIGITLPQSSRTSSDCQTTTRLVYTSRIDLPCFLQ